MTFRPGARLDPSQVEDVRGRGAGGARMRGLALGGGGIGSLILLVVVVLAGGFLNGGGTVDDGLGSLVGQSLGEPGQRSDLAAECTTGADANRRQDCRVVGFVVSIQAFWTEEFSRSGERYVRAPTRLYEGAVDTGCGAASSAVGPFYCPADRAVYLDTGFFDELRTRLGAQGGALADAYVIAHEYGHHVQHLRGTLDPGSVTTGPASDSVRTELQADCYAGVWAANAVDTGYLEPLTETEVAAALDAAAAVGDDRIQERTTGAVHPEAWTHGSARQRQDSFAAGYRVGDPRECVAG